MKNSELISIFLFASLFFFHCKDEKDVNFVLEKNSGFETVKLSELVEAYHTVPEGVSESDHWYHINDQIKRKLLHTVRLSHGSDIFGYTADYVLTCSDLSGDDNLTCQQIEADDTYHVYGFPHSNVRYDTQLPFGFIDQYGKKISSPYKIVFVPGEGSHSEAKIFIQNNEGQFSLQGKGILMVYFRIEGIGYAKYIWVIDPLY
ncbi:MAG: hypothetical protein OEZ34_03225 [Spirochaetia bacterium]|nr:hypothetical protein [Spirochaetia bacterium]